METLHSLSELSRIKHPIHWAMGFFDGVHRGHARVIRSADSPGALRGVLTFREHPLSLLKPDAAPPLLTPDPHFKADRIAALGADILLLLPFTRELADTEPEHFLAQLAAASPIAGISVGANWHFGRGGRGNVDFLRSAAAAMHFTPRINPLLSQSGDTICSSRIRQTLAAGDLERTGSMLGYPFTICGTVEPGQQLARKLGFPTANITLPPNAALPPFGVYEIICEHNGTRHHGIANLGLRPTIREQHKAIRLETHLLGGFSGNLYGQNLRIILKHFIRPEIPFSSIDALKEQIARDIAGAHTPPPAN